MTQDNSLSAPANGIAHGGLSPFQAALVATVMVYGVIFLQALFGSGVAALLSTDSDSQMRLVQVRDLIAGQSWFDLTQYRMGGDGGFVMHWSRFIDLPIAALMLGFGALLGPATGEVVALWLWPALMFLLCVYLIARAAVHYAGEDAVFPAAVIASLSLYMIGEFTPGVIDHHNAQIACTLGMLTFLLESAERPRLAYLAGICAGLMLAIGMETVFYVACGGFAVAVWFLVKGEEAHRQARNFGLGLAATGLVTLILTRRPDQWFAVECDAFSAAQFVAASLAGLGLALAASMSVIRNSFAGRLTALIVIGATIAAVALLWFPQCLDRPYMNMSALSRDYLISSVDETKPVTFLFQRAPVLALLYYGATIFGLIWLMIRVVRRGFLRDDLLLLAILLPAVLVSLYQVRGMKFATPVAAVALAAMVAAARQRAASKQGLASGLVMAAAWLASVNVFWFGLGSTLGNLGASEPASVATAAHSGPEVAGAKGCGAAGELAQLNAMPAGKVASILQLGAPMLRLTQQKPLAGWYHRNEAGNETDLEILMGGPAEAREAALRAGVAYIAVCASEPESAIMRRFAPHGLYAQLVDGQTPDWLTLAPETAGKPLQVYRVTSATAPAS